MAIPSGTSDVSTGKPIPVASLPRDLRTLVEGAIRLYTTTSAVQARALMDGLYSRHAMYENPAVLVWGRSSLAGLAALLRLMSGEVEVQVTALAPCSRASRALPCPELPSTWALSTLLWHVPYPHCPAMPRAAWETTGAAGRQALAGGWGCDHPWLPPTCCPMQAKPVRVNELDSQYLLVSIPMVQRWTATSSLSSVLRMVGMPTVLTLSITANLVVDAATERVVSQRDEISFAQPPTSADFGSRSSRPRVLPSWVRATLGLPVPLVSTVLGA
ncbi:hypothetical protein V8C86DRAFT_969204 [Haematococcus lacustris]